MTGAELQEWLRSILAVATFGVLFRNDRRSEKRIAKVESKVDAVKEHTDGLVVNLGIAKHKEGLQEGRAEGEAKAAALEEGRQQGRDESKP